MTPWTGLRAWARQQAAPPRFLALAAFLFAGELKAAPALSRIPVDLTLASGLLLAGVLALRWAGGARTGGAAGLGLTGLWFLSFLPGAWQAPATPYAFQKVCTIYTFSLMAALAPFVLVQDRDDLRRLLNAMALFCLAMTLDSLLGPGAGPRLETSAGGTIALGRTAGLVFLFGLVQLAEPGPAPLATLAVTAAAGVAALFSGARGPLLGAGLAVALGLFTGRGRGFRARLRPALGAAAAAAFLAAVLALAPAGSRARTEAFLQGRFGASERYRAEALRACAARLGGHPWGLGWGGFATAADLDRGVARQYPHNLLAEVTLESGWICGLTTLLVLAAALGAAWAQTGHLPGRILFAGLVFCLANAMVSGDLNDNRPMFSVLGAALARWRPGRAGGPGGGP